MLKFAFFLSLSALALQLTLYPGIKILAFAPWIALVALTRPLNSTVWLSAAAGALIDLLSDDPMGLHALNYTFTSAFLHRYQRHFLFDRPFHLSLFTGLFSLLSTLLQLLLLFLFDRRVPFSGKWVFIDLAVMPSVDALYAFVWFAAPLLAFEKGKRLWGIFWLKKKSLSPKSH